MKAKKGFIITIVALSALLVCFGVGYGINTYKMNKYTTNLNSMYERSFYELVNNVNNIETEMSKLLVTNDYMSQQKILTTLIQKTEQTQDCLSLLPVQENTINKTTSFVNQLNGYCTSLLNYNSTKISQENYSSFENMYEYVIQIQKELNTLSKNIEGGYRIIDNLKDKNNDLSSNISNINNESIQYPALIYDGPFSDSVLNKEVKSLSNITCTKEQAQEYINEIFKTDSIKYVGKTTGKFTTFDFNVTLSTGKYYIQITERGKFLLTVSGVCKDGSQEYNEDECKQIAEKFMSDLNLQNMKVVWQASADNICYLNLVYTIDNVYVYPDMIKVKVDMTNGAIMGMEASAYAYNHIQRQSQQANFAATTARESLVKGLAVTSQKLVIIPLDYGGECLAYEFSANKNGAQYYIYIDAQTGEQIRVLKVIKTDQGNLLL